MQSTQTAIKKVASGLYSDLKIYKEARKAIKESSGDTNEGLKKVLEDMKKKMKEPPATTTLTGLELHERIIQEKAEVLADLGVLKEVCIEVEVLDEQFGTNTVGTLDNLTAGMI